MIQMKLVRNGDEGIILMTGVLDSKAAPEAERILRGQAQNFEILTLDFAELEYISSAGLRILKLLHSDLLKKSGKLKLRNVNSSVMEVFDLVGLSGMLTIES